MQNLIKLFVFICFEALVGSADVTVDSGMLSQYNYPDLKENIQKVWNYVESTTGLKVSKPGLAAPEVYLSPFVFAQEKNDWVVWKKQWIKDHPEIWDDWKKQFGDSKPAEEGNPFPKKFVGFHFYGSNRVQLDPTILFIPFYQFDSNGQRKDSTGIGYYSIGHEFHHYALYQQNLPIRLHHCVFVLSKKSTGQSYMEDLANHLVDQKISSFYIFSRGAQMEAQINPCGYLNAADQALAQKWVDSH